MKRHWKKILHSWTRLEESFTIYAEGMKLLKACGDKLDKVEKKMLVMNEEGKLDEF